MVRTNKNKVSSRAERALLSDVLPYELPVSFDNAGFVALLSELKIRISGRTVTAQWIGESTSSVLSLIFGGVVSVSRPAQGTSVTFCDPRLGREQEFPRTKSLSFNIGKNASGIRSVSMMHPRSQLAVVDFYARHADSILHYTKRSPFSIRHASDVARFSVFRDAVFSSNLDHEPTGVEEDDREYERLRSFFTYGGYSHIYKFHESPEMRTLERKYARLVHVDVTRCFDSIYTHAISWVTNGLEDSKTRTNSTTSTFGGRFDKLMQSANDLETHGILIGPEVSRIFAEVMLQEVDVRAERALRLSNDPLLHRRDYEIRRFVDDFFIFCASDEDAARIVNVLSEELRKFRLYLNDAKRKDQLTPLVSERSIAKYKFKLSIRRLITAEVGDGDPGNLPILVTSTEALLLEYKDALLSTGLSHGDLANYALVQVEFAFERALRRWQSIATDEDAPEHRPRQADWIGVARFLTNTIDVAVSLFAGGVAASHSVKLARIAHTALRFMSVAGMPRAMRAVVESKIAEELSRQIHRPPATSGAPMHSLILLDALASMHEDGGVSAPELRKLLNLKESSPDAIALLTTLRYCRRRPDLDDLRAELEDLAIESASFATEDGTPETGATLLACALLDSPFLLRQRKRDLARKLRLPSNFRPGGSTPWTRFFQWEVDDYYDSLQRKRGGDVY
ncbi:RNA-directed DNA polymerase [Microbacterium oxydans]|uniref:antiviral reverse transcriptase Drt3b n=1 Tax=Microbacterium sp. B19(2022) TaxID=2914045 RepID=UPI0014307511|nr:RNA-directed DNA polymerase [Microbacterium sp. B19(2022)]